MAGGSATTTSIRIAWTPLVSYVIGLADDALVLGHRLSEWCGHAPMLEEELALANIGLDLIGQARSLYSYAAECEGAGHDEDALAFLRDPPEFRNVLLAEQPNGDFAATITRQLFYSAFADPFWRAMMRSDDPTLAAIAAKSEKESAYHLRHASEWAIRLGDGTAESTRRMRDAVDGLWSFTGELFEPAAAPSGVAADASALRPIWDATIRNVFARAALAVPADPWMRTGGRTGRHTEHLGRMLADMQHLPRSFPGAVW